MEQMVTIEHFRPGSTDDKYVIPELVTQDMFRMEHLSKLIADYPGDIVDCGAQIGVFTTLVAEHMDRTVHSIEPTTANYAYLEKNTEKYGARVKRYKVAVALEAMTLLMTEDADNKGNFMSSPDLGAGDGGAGDRGAGDGGAGDGGDGVGAGDGEQVEAISLPKFIRDLGQVALLKLDLEGAEAAILNGMDEETLRLVGMLVIEEHDQPINHRRLKAMGFRVAFRPLDSKRHVVYVRGERPSFLENLRSMIGFGS
jgi:FkbM family methyltransferase